MDYLKFRDQLDHAYSKLPTADWLLAINTIWDKHKPTGLSYSVFDQRQAWLKALSEDNVAAGVKPIPASSTDNYGPGV